MNQRVANESIKRVAEREQLSVESVPREMEFAIRDAYNNLNTRHLWKQEFGFEEEPTPEELLVQLARYIA